MASSRENVSALDGEAATTKEQNNLIHTGFENWQARQPGAC